MSNMKSGGNKKQEQISTLLELEQARHELAMFQLSKPHRFAKAFNKLKENPLKAPVAAGEMFKALLPVEKPNPPDTSQEYIDSLTYPLPLTAMVNTLLYPRVKIGVIGRGISEYGTVAHAFRAGGTDWNNLLEFGIDLLVITLSGFRGERHEKLVKEAWENNVKILVIKDSNKQLPQSLADAAALILDRSDNTDFSSDYPFADITEHNPINLVVKRGTAYSIGQELEAATKISRKELGRIEPNDVVYLPPSIKLSFSETKRLLELAACGSVIVAEGQDTFLPSITVPNGEEPSEYLRQVNSDLELKTHEGARQRRDIVLDHSQIKRFEKIAMELDIPLSPYRPLVSILLSSRRPDYTEQILRFISIFETKHMDTEVIFVAHGDKFDVQKVEHELERHQLKGKVLQRGNDTVFGDNLNFALEHATGDFVTKLDDDDLYGKNHLEDVYAAYLYSGANITGKWSHWIYFEDEDISMTWVKHRQESYVMHIPGGTLFCRRDFLLKNGGFGHVSRGIDSELYRRIRSRGGVLYSTHKYNYVRVRHGVEHTYDISHEDFKTQCSPPEIEGTDTTRVFT